MTKDEGQSRIAHYAPRMMHHVSRITNQSASIPGPETIERREYPNGMVVLVKENFTNPTVVIDGTLRFGSAAVKREQAGLASFMADVLMRGTQRRTFQQIYEAIESVGATADVSAGLNVSSFGSKSLAEDLPRAIDILADVLQHPTFPEAEVEKVRGEILTDLEERANDTRRMAGLTFRELLYPDVHPYANSGTGYNETIAALTRDDLERFYRKRIGPQGMIVAIVGAVKADEAFRIWEDAFGNWTVANSHRAALPDAPRVSNARRKSVDVPGKTQSDLILGFVGPARSAPDYFPAALCNTILGVFGLNGRVGAKVRVQGGMAYYAYTSLEGGLGPGAWSVIAGVHPSKVDRAVELIRAEIKRICESKVPAKELGDNKAYITGSLPLRLETNDGVAAQISNMELYGLGLDYLQKYTDMVNAITAQQVQAAAQRYLDPDAYALAIADPISKGTCDAPLRCVARQEHIMLSNGVDIVRIPRVQKALDLHGERFLNRVFTPREIKACRGHASEFAARFAAKEAVSKALGVGMRIMARNGIGFKDVEILPDGNGKPHVHLYGRASARAEELGLKEWAVSLTHEREYALAFVVAMS